MVEAGLVALLQANASVQNLCGGRIYPLNLPDDSALPALSYQRISSRSDYALDGASLTSTLLQCDAFAHTYAQARELEAAVLAVVDGFRGTLPDGTFVFSILRASSHDIYENDPRSWRVSFDLRITHL